jgi:hypothetical protein
LRVHLWLAGRGMAYQHVVPCELLRRAHEREVHAAELRRAHKLRPQLSHSAATRLHARVRARGRVFVCASVHARAQCESACARAQSRCRCGRRAVAQP